MDFEKFNAVINYFTESNLYLPTEVRNAIQDVFEENDNIETVECYHKNELENFEKDMTLERLVKIDINGKHLGMIEDVWTYYGEISYELVEHINLYNGDFLIQEISNANTDLNTVLLNEKDYAVVLIEKTIWDTSQKSEVEKKVGLYIYCPYNDTEYEEDKYADVYNTLKREGF